MSRPILVLTGHFPPEPGGVQTFAWELVRRLPPEQVVVVGPTYRGARRLDATLPFPVLRRRGYWLTRNLRGVVGEHGCRIGWVPAAAPFGLFTPWLRRAGVERVVASSHGQELGWLKVGPTREAIRRMARGLDVLTYLGPVMRERLAAVVDDPGILRQLAGGVDVDLFRPRDDRAEVRRRLGLDAGPLVVSHSRLVRRKGHDRLLEAWPDVVRRVPGARLAVVGVGPMRRRLEAAAADGRMRGSVTVTGYLPRADVAALLGAADAFVLPCRDDRAGLQTEGLGLSTLEASASGLPVVVGRSGGSVDAVVDGRTGLLVDGARPGEIADALVRLLTDGDAAREMGRAGAAWVRERWTWDGSARRLRQLLDGALG